MKRKFPLTQTNPCSGKHPERFFFRIKATTTALFLSIFLLAGASLHAATITSVANGDWSNGATWDGGIAPVADDNVIIDATHTVTLTAAVDIGYGNLTVDGTLALAGFDLTVGSLSGAGPIGSASGTPTLTVDYYSYYDGVYSGTGAKLTVNTWLTLTGANTYSGATTINSYATLDLGAANVLPDASDIILIYGTLNTNGFDETAGSLVVLLDDNYSGSTIYLGSGDHSLHFANSSASSWATDVQQLLYVYGWSGTAGSSGTDGKIFFGNSTGGLTDQQLSQIVFDPYAGNPKLLSTGELVPKFGYQWNATSGSADWQDEFSWTPARTTPAADDVLFFAQGGSSTATNVPTETVGQIELDNYTSLTLQAAAGGNTISIQGGSGYDLDIASGSTLIIGSSTGGALAMGVDFTGSGHQANIVGTLNTNIINNANTYNTVNATTTVGYQFFVGGTLVGDVTTAIYGSVQFTRADNYTYSGVISGTGGISKSGAGTLTLSGANTYTGVTTLSAGTLKLGAAGVIPDASRLNMSSGTTFDLNGFSETIGALSGQGTVTSSVAGAVTFSADGDSNYPPFSGVISNGSGTVALNKVGTGKLLFNNSANTYTGGTTITAGELVLYGSTIVGNVVDNGKFTIDGLQAITTFSGVISGTGSVDVSAAQFILTLTGANTYTGPTTINNGTLKLGANNLLPDASDIIFNSTSSVNLPTLETGGFNETVGKLTVMGSFGEAIIKLGTGNHSLNFANSSTPAWSTNASLTVTGWTGTAGSSGTAGKIFFGSASGLTSTQLVQSEISGFLGTSVLLGSGELVPPLAPPVYTWNATSGSADWQTSGSWTPARTTPSVSDLLKFSNGGTSTATNVPTETISQLIMSGNTAVILEAASAAGHTITISGTSGIDLLIPGGSALTLGSGSNAMSMDFSVSSSIPIAKVRGTFTVTNGNPLSTLNTTNATFFLVGFQPNPPFYGTCLSPSNTRTNL